MTERLNVAKDSKLTRKPSNGLDLLLNWEQKQLQKQTSPSASESEHEDYPKQRSVMIVEPSSPHPEEEDDHESDTKKPTRAISISSPSPSSRDKNSGITLPVINVTQDNNYSEVSGSPVRQHVRLTASAKKHTRSRSALEGLEDLDTTIDDSESEKPSTPHSNSLSSLNLHVNGTQSGYTTPNSDMSPSEKRKIYDPHKRLALLEVEVERLTRKLKAADELHKRETEQYQARLHQEVEKRNQALEECSKLQALHLSNVEKLSLTLAQERIQHIEQMEALRKEKDITISYLENRLRKLEKILEAKGQKRSHSAVTLPSSETHSDVEKPEKTPEKSKEGSTAPLQLRRSNSSHSEPPSPDNIFDDRPSSNRISARHRSKTVCFTDDTNLPATGATRSTRSTSVGNEEDQNWSSLLRSLSQVETNPTLNLVLETRSVSSANSDQEDWNSEEDDRSFSDNDSIPPTPTSQLEPSDLQDKPITMATQQKSRGLEHSPSIGSTGSTGSQEEKEKKKKKRDWRKSLPASLNLKAEKEKKEREKNRPSTLRPSHHSSYNDTEKAAQTATEKIQQQNLQQQLAKQKSAPVLGMSPPPQTLSNSNTIPHQPHHERSPSTDKSAFLTNPFNTVGRIFGSKSRSSKNDLFEPEFVTTNPLFGSKEKEEPKKPEGVFGFPLESLAVESETGIPTFLTKLIGYLQHITDLNLFTECSDMQELKQVRELCQSGVVAFNFINVKDDSIVANLLYNFLDELPDPVFTYSLYSKFYLWTEIEDTKYKFAGLRSLANSLPHTNRKVSDYLMNFFRNLVARIHKIEVGTSSLSTFLTSESNAQHVAVLNVTIQKLASIFGPIFLKSAPPTATPHSAISHAISTLMTGVNTSSSSKIAVNNNNVASVFKAVFLHWEPALLAVPIVRSTTSPRPSIGSNNDLTQFFQTEQAQEIRYIIRDGFPVVYAASVEKLLEKTFDDFYRDNDFLDIVFITHPYFIVSAKLLERFVDLYNSFDPKKPWQERIRLKILENTKTWVTHYSEDLKRDPSFVSMLKQFVAKTAGANKLEETLLGFFRVVLGVMETNANAGKELRRKQSQKLITNLKIDVQDLEILDIDYIELAEQITLIDHDLLKAITPNEFLHKNFDSPKSAPFFNAMVNKFNEWTMWVVTEVLKKQKPNTRAMVVAHFIKVAQKCREHNNFHSCYAIIAGLNYSAVSRLKLTWEKVPRKQMLKYKELCDVFDMSHNFKNYRDTLHNSTPPIVPYLGLIPKDLTSLEELPNVTDDNLVNFDKMRTLRKILMQIREYQIRGYAFTVLPELATFLKHLKVISKDQAFKLSLDREPRKTT